MLSRFTDIRLEYKRLTPSFGYEHEKLVSLKEAIEPIKGQVADLDAGFQLAISRTYLTKHGLTHDEAAAVYLYTLAGDQNGFYRKLNKALRSNDQNMILPWFLYLKLLDTALRKLPTVADCVWRGVPGHVHDQYKENQIIFWPTVSSCSLSVKVLEKFLSPTKPSTIFMIQATSAKYVAEYSAFPEEQEAILRPGTEMHVKSNAFHYNDLCVVHLVETNGIHEDKSEYADYKRYSELY